MSDVDRMDVLAHWLVRDVQGTVVVTDEAVAAAYRAHGTPIEGPFIPAEQLREAVDALREVERICAVAGGEHSSSPVVVQIVRAARTGLGGQ